MPGTWFKANKESIDTKNSSTIILNAESTCAFVGFTDE